jgi:hypothetical protein
MATSRHIAHHLTAIRQLAADETLRAGPETTVLTVQRIKITVQNLRALANKTLGVERAARDIDTCLPRCVVGETPPALLDERLSSALEAFEAALEAAGPTEVAKRIGAWSGVEEAGSRI